MQSSELIGVRNFAETYGRYQAVHPHIGVQRQDMHEKSPSKIWRMQSYKYRLLGSYCRKCKNKFYPYKSFCPVCHSTENIKEYTFKPYGKIVSWSQIYVSPLGFEKYVPYVIALVKLEEGPVILSQIVDCETEIIKEGLEVEAVFRRLMLPDKEGVIKYGIKFRPAVW